MLQENGIATLINSHQRRLQKLKEQQATQGRNTPPEILIEIQDIEQKTIPRLQEEIVRNLMRSWLHEHPDLQWDDNNLFKVIKENITIKDQEYARELKKLLATIGDSERVKQTDDILTSWDEQKAKGKIDRDEEGPIIPWEG